MPRQPRFLPPDNYYHIMNRGNNGRLIFNCDDDYAFYLKRLFELKTEHPFDLIHYCLMGTHTHMLVKILKDTDFSIFSKRLNLSYANYFRNHYGLIGHFWQGRFKSQLISKDNYFIQCGKYIELNPIRAGLIQNPEEYKWSSYNHYAFGQNNPLVTDDILYAEISSHKKEKEKYYRDLIISEIVADSMTSKKIAIGTDKFVYNMNKRNKYHLENKGSSYRQSPGLK